MARPLVLPVTLDVSWLVTGEPAPRRPKIPFELADGDGWLVDAKGAAVAAVWDGAVLRLGGAAVYAVGERVERLSSDGPGPAGGEAVASWVRVTPQQGQRYVVVAGAMEAPEGPRSLSREAQAAAVVSSRAPGLLARLLGRKPSTDGVVLIVDVSDDEPAAGLREWIASLRGSAIDLSWTGNEAGPGLLHGFAVARGDQDVVSALLAQARQDEVVAAHVAEAAQAWLEDLEGPPPTEHQLVDGVPERGWWQEVALDPFAAGVFGSGGAWLDPGTPQARLGWSRRLSGARIVETLTALVDGLAVIAVGSQPDHDRAVLVCHLVGGVDRRTGEVVGFVLERVWT